MTRYARVLRPDVVVVTSIGSEHLTSLGRLEVTRHEKAEMVRALSPNGLAVLNGDDPNVRWMAGETRARVVTCGLGPNNDIRATNIVLEWPTGQRFTLWLGDQHREVRVRLLGRHQLFSILAAVAVARHEGLMLDEVLVRLTALPPTDGRLEPIALPNGAWLLRDDFKSSVETIDAALDLLAEIPTRCQVLLGDISEPPRPPRPAYRRLGVRLSETVDRAIVVGEKFAEYAAGARSVGLPPGGFLDAGRDVLRGVELLNQDLRPGDTVLIKGRGRQRLERAALVLQGRSVRCNISICPLSMKVQCARCRLLERGWDDQPGLVQPDLG
jgi:UDP-N-acetylmuramoyl-tripeptide--D-alanyl-D-alanine ligase